MCVADCPGAVVIKGCYRNVLHHVMCGLASGLLSYEYKLKLFEVSSQSSAAEFEVNK